ncbi:WAT1-related protein At1g09380 isoform X1 [Lathyrus oleraceus]|uniref:WAT1-related protein n=1 Tax=Pisum sativum TaxID=3888 RepID=A0A9D5BA36_PEA|nr:WAT1-related protein At1g09380-like isoform X1 [Pisum sativum]KAI5435320.1 hypothetical protein KIW84_021944 [Pisum sativum]KAI5435321.1 hypothetical protein KIW84_021944 [Pisum sativum]
MESVKKWFMSSQAFLSMLLVQIFATGMQLLSRIILVQGSFIFALTTYRYIVAAVSIAPFALYFERGLAKKFNWRILLWLFINALVGMTMSLGLFYFGLRDTTATYSVNFLNLIPICTFLISIMLRIENLKIETLSGKAKCLGTIACVGGALATSLYKGKEFYIGQHHNHYVDKIVTATHKTHMLHGTFFLIGSCCSYTTWFIMQVKLVKVFPLRYWGTMLSCIMAAIQSAVIGVFINSSKESWRLEWNLQLITILYSGVLATAATFCLLSWAITIKGPTYPSMFNPLTLVFVAILEAIVLGEPLRVGTLLGMILIILGLYYFLWGKRNEMPHMSQTNVAASELSISMTDDATVHKSTTTIASSSSPYESIP